MVAVKALVTLLKLCQYGPPSMLQSLHEHRGTLVRIQQAWVASWHSGTHPTSVKSNSGNNPTGPFSGDACHSGWSDHRSNVELRHSSSTESLGGTHDLCGSPYLARVICALADALLRCVSQTIAGRSCFISCLNKSPGPIVNLSLSKGDFHQQFPNFSSDFHFSEASNSTRSLTTNKRISAYRFDSTELFTLAKVIIVCNTQCGAKAL